MLRIRHRVRWARSRRSIVAAIATALGLLSLVSFGAIVSSEAAVDTNAPVLASLAMTPTTVDTSSGPAVITITARLTDERSPSIGGTRAAQPHHPDRTRGPAAGDRVRLAGATHLRDRDRRRLPVDALDPVARRARALGCLRGPGRYLRQHLDVDHGEPRCCGLPGSSVNQTGPGDTAAPQLVALGISPSSVDTSLQSATITVSVHAVDDLSGVSDGVAKAASQVVLRGPSGAHHARATLSVDHRTGGNPLDATFVVAVTLPRWSEQGTWTVESATLIDQVGNRQIVDRARCHVHADRDRRHVGAAVPCVLVVDDERRRARLVGCDRVAQPHRRRPLGRGRRFGRLAELGGVHVAVRPATAYRAVRCRAASCGQRPRRQLHDECDRSGARRTGRLDDE